MSTQSDNKLVYSLLNHYDKLYFDSYGVKPKYNKYREKWAMQDVVDSIGFDRAKDLITYYFRVSKPKHPLTWFFYNFDKLDDMLNAAELDKIKREKMREKTKRMVEEYERGSSSN